MLSAVVLAGALLQSSPCIRSKTCVERRLSAFIIRRNDRAKPFAHLLARRIFIEARRHRLSVADLTAIAWIESDFRPGLKGTSREVGVWQLRPFDHRLPVGWVYVRSMPGEFPIPRCRLRPDHRRRDWKRLRYRLRQCIIDDIAAGTYLAALEIASARRLCRRLGHRVGVFRCSKPFISQCPTFHGQKVDRLAHYNSGVRPLRSGYVAKLRRRSRQIRALLR